FQPGLELLQIDIVFFQLGVGEVLNFGFVGDLGLEVGALAKEFFVFLVAVCLEAGNDFVFLSTIKRNRFQQDGIARHFVDLVLDDLESPGVIVGLGQQADAVL